MPSIKKLKDLDAAIVRKDLVQQMSETSISLNANMTRPQNPALSKTDIDNANDIENIIIQIR